jgi:hypothetical protein
MFMTEAESGLIFSHITPDMRILEYGAGRSTKLIASKCNSITSIEHQPSWYETVLETLPENASLLLRTPDLPYREGGDDGSYEQFKSYVEAPLGSTFDIIIIDGRARVACASICHLLCKSGGFVFIHDFERSEYKAALEYLDMISLVGEMALLKVKNA